MLTFSRAVARQRLLGVWCDSCASTAAIFLSKNDDLTRVPIEESQIELIDMVSLINTDGDLLFNDYVSKKSFPNQQGCKLSLSNFNAKGIWNQILKMHDIQLGFL